MKASEIYETDDFTQSIDRFGWALVRIVNDQLDVDSLTESVAFVTTLDKSTLTVTVSWDPCGKPPSEWEPIKS